MTTTIKWTIALLMGATLFRAQTVLFLPTVEMFGGVAPDGWFGPWLSDSILGFLAPVMIFVFLTRRGIRVWGALVLYNAIGAFDYSQGLITQYVSPMPAEMAAPMTVYAGIGFFMALQLSALRLLFRRDVVQHFTAPRNFDRPETTERKDEPMPMSAYPIESTALLFIDPYNDFLAEDGKMWPAVSEVALSVDLHANLARVRAAVREVGVPIFILPHHRHQPADFDRWAHLTPSQSAAHGAKLFAVGSWGGEWYPGFGPEPGDVVVKEHWGASSFANTDLDVQLRQRGVTHVIFIGMIANTCIESSARHASELGYHVTLVRDATAAFSAEAMHAAHDVNGPTYAHSILTTAELVQALEGKSSK